MSSFRPELTPEVFNGRSPGYLPGLLGLQILTQGPEGTDRKIALFRCTQMVSWPK